MDKKNLQINKAQKANFIFLRNTFFAFFENPSFDSNKAKF